MGMVAVLAAEEHCPEPRKHQASLTVLEELCGKAFGPDGYLHVLWIDLVVYHDCGF